jgi:hypothetical protein
MQLTNITIHQWQLSDGPQAVHMADEPPEPTSAENANK